jgi:hypothetical protein
MDCRERHHVATTARRGKRVFSAGQENAMEFSQSFEPGTKFKIVGPLLVNDDVIGVTDGECLFRQRAAALP